MMGIEKLCAVSRAQIPACRLAATLVHRGATPSFLSHCASFWLPRLPRRMLRELSSEIWSDELSGLTVRDHRLSAPARRPPSLISWRSTIPPNVRLIFIQGTGQAEEIFPLSRGGAGDQASSRVIVIAHQLSQCDAPSLKTEALETSAPSDISETSTFHPPLDLKLPRTCPSTALSSFVATES
jgi:hypothetical protein